MKAKERDNALNEIRILASYSDDFIIGYKEAFYDESSGTLCIVMEFASGGDVLKKNQNHLKNKSRYKE
jgi:NIMA (never in mitosis gene a)-related kinase